MKEDPKDITLEMLFARLGTIEKKLSNFEFDSSELKNTIKQVSATLNSAFSISKTAKIVSLLKSIDYKSDHHPLAFVPKQLEDINKILQPVVVMMDELQKELVGMRTMILLNGCEKEKVFKSLKFDTITAINHNATMLSLFSDKIIALSLVVKSLKPKVIKPPKATKPPIKKTKWQKFLLWMKDKI